VALLSILAFLPGVFGQFVGWDDDRNFLDLPSYRGVGVRQLSWMFTAFQMGHYTPLTWITLGADYVLWGMNPFGYHVTSLVLHAATAAMFLFVSRRLIQAGMDGRIGDAALRIGAAGAALLFAIHPLRVESVVWLSERRDVLSGLFYMLTVLAYLKAVDRRPGTDGAVSRVSWGWYWASIALFLGALLSKALVVSLPVVLLIIDVYPLRRLGPAGDTRRVAAWLGSSARRVWIEKVPFFLLGLAGAAVAFAARAPLRAAPGLEEFDVVARLAVCMYGLAFYLWKTVYPINLSPLYEMPAYLNLLSPVFIASGLVVSALFVLAFIVRRRWPAFTAAWCAYVVTLFPVIGVVQSGPQITADRYTYLACLAWALLGGAGLAWCAEVWLSRAPRWRPAGAILVGAAVLIVGLVGLAARQSLVWHDSVTLWNHALAIDPSSPRAHTGLAGAFFSEGKRGEAQQHLEEAVRLNPRLPEALMGLAVTLTLSDRKDEAVRYARRVVSLRPQDPDVYRFLGDILRVRESFEEALAAYQQAARLNPQLLESHYKIAVALAELGRRAEAIGALETAHDLARARDDGSPDGDRYTAMVFTASDPERARAAWRRYLAAMGKLKHPNRLDEGKMVEALVALEKLEKLERKEPERAVKP